jgi:hypothetical protein
MKTKPDQSFRIDLDGALVCPHRGTSCCPACAGRSDIVAVYGRHYFAPTAAERAELIALTKGKR